ncbi:ring finger domain-containing protein [Lichtheimia corymbifera JMRC:FSU:9682]|uniref:Ring finger domain-containing protein n=1 Tax=Lichtheimia corymbifera JMRC:FSU:9682 TaxID=1263082 RepID=A0A068SHP0_9FUNG|nr:ring finger domain-containing protein [Lichtheimia corymbifera JMRC:FSU:9682]
MPKSTTSTSTRRARESVAQANTARAKVVIDLTGDSDGEPSNSNSNRRIAHNTTTSSSSSSTTQALSRARQDIADTYQALNALQQRKRKKATRRPPMSATAMRNMQSRLQRALTQRMFVFRREQKSQYHAEFQVLGSTGNLYTVKIANHMTCSCFDYVSRHLHCKHLLLVLARVFNLTGESPAYASLSLTDEELHDMFANCSPAPGVMVDERVKAAIERKLDGVPEEDRSNRKPLDDADCPICYEALSDSQPNTIIYCKTCGNNVHKGCFTQWSNQLSRQGLEISCVFCRTRWEDPNGTRRKAKTSEGYANFADEAGISTVRDTSTYRSSAFWEGGYRRRRRQYPGERRPPPPDDYEGDIADWYGDPAYYYLVSAALFLSSHNTMPVTRSRSTTTRTQSARQRPQESNASNNNTPQEHNESSAAAAETSTNATIAAPLSTARSTNAERRKKKRRQSPTDPANKGPANTPKRLKGQPSFKAEVQERLDRALSQRMYVVSRIQRNDHHIQFHVLGSTGNYYTVDITNKMKCDCFDHRYRRLHCKHLLLVLARVFHVERGSPAYVKLLLTNEELQEVFANCAPDPTVMVDDDVKALINSKMHGEPVEDESSLNRKSLKEDPDCPICYETLTEDQATIITFCKVCGNNVHEDCFQQWTRQLTKQGQTVTCVFCRSPWEIPKPIAEPKKSVRGFANFAQESGLVFELEEELEQSTTS